jgi:hypothetical protein
MNYTIILIIIFILIIAYLLGINLVNHIDNKLNNIKINVEYPKIESFKNNNEDLNIKNNNEHIKNNNEYIKNNNEHVKNNNKQIKTNFDNEYYNQMDKNSKVEGFSNTFDFKEWDIENKKTQTCIKNHKHVKNGNDLNCTYGLTNYRDPDDLSEIDYKLFYLNYPKNMTLQDYINWLYCYIDKEDQLPYNHLKNLEKIKLGKELVEEHGILPPPGYHYSPLNAKEYFEKIYSETNEFNIAPPLNSNTGSMLGYNYNDYSEFSQNADLYGSTGKIRNTDIGIKKNTKKLYEFVNPKDSSFMEETDKYNIYRMKNIEV